MTTRDGWDTRITMRDLLDGWDGDVIEVTLASGLKQTGVSSLFTTGEFVTIGIDTPGETIYRIDAIVGVRWVRDGNEHSALKE